MFARWTNDRRKGWRRLTGRRVQRYYDLVVHTMFATALLSQVWIAKVEGLF